MSTSFQSHTRSRGRTGRVLSLVALLVAVFLLGPQHPDYILSSRDASLGASDIVKWAAGPDPGTPKNLWAASPDPGTPRIKSDSTGC